VRGLGAGTTELAGSATLVTRAARGIGRGIALAGEGVHVAGAVPGAADDPAIPCRLARAGERHPLRGPLRLSPDPEGSVREVEGQTTSLGHEQTPEDVAEVVIYLCRAENVAGVAPKVAGGVEMRW